MTSRVDMHCHSPASQAVHVLCYGIAPGDHEWLQAHSGDVEACAARGRSWERSMGQLAAGYRRALDAAVARTRPLTRAA
jgi:hypothetical protein